ncbi:efflux RND transporter permease subunit [Ekhidna sp.]|jgi:multidrug efflux pump subunit AcrB|uniref:efflux RND transporter permease subunit n=1 Tax=Ekhidna sp. TaxID=2608089 RepID=UPI0032EE8493
MTSIKGLIEYFVKYPILANILIALTLVGGVVSMLNTKKSFFPTLEDKNITVSVSYPGASPDEMEEGVTLKIEEALKGVIGIYQVTSTSSENFATINIQKIDGYDIDELYTDVKNSVDGISSFPAGAEKPIIVKQKSRTTAQWLALTGDVDLATLKQFAEDIEDELLATGVISQVGISGFPPLEISIEVAEDVLRRYNLTFTEVANAVRVNNRDVSAGSVKTSTEEILIRARAKDTDADKIGDIVIRSSDDGKNLLLRDIATIEEKFADQPNKSYLSGERAVFIEVRRLEREDLEQISETVNNYVVDFNEKNDAVKLTMTWDFMSMLNQRLDMLTSNGLVGLTLVLVSLGLFLSLRLSFWVAWGIPSSFLGMFILGTFVGLTINMISLFGMILVIGILVDDGIVIAENIYSHFEKHGNPIKAAVQGTLEVVPAVFTSILTTMVAFTPLLLLTGGFEMLKDMAIVVIFSLGFSLIEAFFVLPAHLSSKHVLSIKKEDTRSYKIRSFLNGIIDYLRVKVYGKALQFTMKYRAVSVSIVIAFVMIIVGMMKGGIIPSTLFPPIAFNSVNIEIAFKPGEREDKVEEYLKRFDKAVWRVNEELKEQAGTDKDIVKNTFTSIGSSSFESGSHTGFVNVFHEELDEFDLNQYDIINKLRAEIGSVPEAEKFAIGGRSRWGKPVSVRILGKNYEELAEAKEFLISELDQMPALKDVTDDIPIGNREVQLDLLSQAYFLGLTNSDITQQLRQGFFGEEVQRFMKGNDEIKVWVRYPKEDRKSIDQLETVKIKDGDKEYPLSQLAEYEINRGVSGIKHYEASRSVTVEADMVDPFGDANVILEKVEKDIVPKMLAKFPTVKVDYGGQAEERARSAGEMATYFLGAFIVILFILMINFRSVYQAILIILMVPLGWFSGILGHGIETWISVTPKPVSMLSLWGMIALMGVIINDAVVFLSKFNSLVKDDGQSVYQAAYNAGLARFRPIMLTSLTTVLGLYPLIKETSFQAQFLIPMAISVAYGVLFGTIIILLFFPVFILIANDLRRYAKWLWTGDKPSREDVERVLIDERRMEEYKESA